MIINEFFTGLLGGLIVVKHVEGVMLLIFRIDPITGEAAPQAVAPVVHNGNGFDNSFSAETPSVLSEDP